MSADEATLPLAPYTVVEVPAPGAPALHRLALGLAGKIAGDLGARVIKLVPRAGDPLHAIPVLPWEAGAAPAAAGRYLDTSKTVVALDLDDPADRAEADRLVAGADAVLTDGPYANEEIWRDRVAVLVQALPPGSPLAGAPLSEICLLALSGMPDIVGDPARAPLMLGGHQAAYAAGLAAFSALATGLAGLAAHGTGECYDVDVRDVLAWVNWKAVFATAFRGGSPVSREGRQAEWQVVRCKDGWIAVVFNEKDWPALARLVGHPDLLDPALTNVAGRAARRADYMPHIERWCAERTRDEAYRAAQAVKVPFGPVVDPAEMPADPQLSARSALARLDDGTVMPQVPGRWSGHGFAPRPTLTAAGAAPANARRRIAGYSAKAPEASPRQPQQQALPEW